MQFSISDQRAKIAARGIFQKRGEHQTAPMTIQQTVEDYVAAQHARSSLAFETMTAAHTVQFDQEMQALLVPYANDELLTFRVISGITWDQPLHREH